MLRLAFTLSFLMITVACTQGAVNVAINSSASRSTSSGSSTSTSTSGGSALVSCPTNYVMVPALSGYTTSNFCLAKYEMKNVGNVATSQAALSPWGNVDTAASITACQALGTGYDLISNDEWQTVARNLEGTSFNWGSHYGDAHQTFISQGRKPWDSGTVNPVAADVDSNPCYLADDGQGSDDSNFLAGSGGVCDLNTWNIRRRINRLSNGEYLWDFSGNTIEHVKYTTSAADTESASNTSTFYGASWGAWYMSRVLDTAGPFLTNMKTRFGPAGNYAANSWLGTPGDHSTEENWNHDGMGVFFVNVFTATVATDDLVRGEDGIFSTEFKHAGDVGVNMGFRCVYHGE